MRPHFILYSRETCHLCHDMHEELRLWQTRLDFSFEVVDIEDDAALIEQYGLMIPVLSGANGDVICFGRLDVTALTNSIDQTLHL